MKQMSTINQPPTAKWISLAALFAGVVSLILISPKWVIPFFAWIAPAAILFYTGSAGIKGKWIWLWLGLVSAGFISGYEVFPMPLVVLVIFSLIDATKLLLVFLVDKWITEKADHFTGTLVFPALMVTKEFIKANGGGGVWSSMANTQFGFSWFSQLASVTGLWGITFMICWFASVIVWAYGKYKRRERFSGGIIIYSSFLLIILAYGAIRYHAERLGNKQTIKVAGLTVPVYSFFEGLYEDYSGKKIKIDPKISQSSPQLQEVNKALLPFLLTQDSIKFKRGFVALDKLYDSLFILSQKAADAGAKFISWSEGNAFLIKGNDEKILQRGKDFTSLNKVYLIMAMAVVDPGKIKQGKKFIENKAILLGPGGNVLNVLHKNKPVPMVEQSEPGDQVIPVISTAFGNVSTSICYDADFPALMQQLGKKKSDVLFLPSGDWYAISPYHSYMAAMRGIENGVSIVRQVSGGLSIVSDYRGRIQSSFYFFGEGEKLWIADVKFGNVPTIYSAIGDVLAWLSVATSVISILFLVITFGRKLFLRNLIKGKLAQPII
jgi:apolipoprotein N-acyltransferase